jgi:hypothetical protein
MRAGCIHCTRHFDLGLTAMALSARLEILRNQTRRACEAWGRSVHSRGRTAEVQKQMVLCDRAPDAWTLIAVVAQNVAADRIAQEDLGRLGPAADPPRLRMLVLHRELLQAEAALGALPPARKQVVDALRSVTAAQIVALRQHAARVRQALGPARNADLEELLG